MVTAELGGRPVTVARAEQTDRTVEITLAEAVAAVPGQALVIHIKASLRHQQRNR